ncbi:MAG TPA: hypothetical protein VHX39_19760, partial [Acetobacteraceae bacterium]|nr:hypothetical protein [Acetobacteraceae bacterium]
LWHQVRSSARSAQVQAALPTYRTLNSGRPPQADGAHRDPAIKLVEVTPAIIINLTHLNIRLVNFIYVIGSSN